MASIASLTTPNNSKSIPRTSSSFTKSSSRVFIDVSVPRHNGPRLSLADVDPDASNALKTSSKPPLKSIKNDTKANDASGRQALKPTTRTNSFTSNKRGREEDKEGNEGAKKRKVEVDGKIQKNTGNVNTVIKARGGTILPKKKLDTTTVTVAPTTVADSEVLVKKVVVKKPQPEPQPLWTHVGIDFTREEIEERILLREFTLRFNGCLGLKRTVLEKLEDFGDFDDATAKALLLAIMEFLRQDSPPDERRVLADFIKQVRARGMSFYDILYTMHHKLRTSTNLHIPNLSTVLKKKDDVDSTALIPILLALIDDVLETDAARKEVDRWKEEGAEVRRTYFRGMKEEKEHWGPIRVKLVDEKKAGGAGFDAVKWKKKLEAAKAKHDAAEHALKFTLIKQLAEIAPRFTPLVDMDERAYYFQTPSLRKPPAKSTRDDFGKWAWFVAVWGARPVSAKRVDEGKQGDGEDGGESSSLTEEESEDEISGAKEAKEAKRVGREGWWGFGEAAELRLLAKWIQWRDQEAGAAGGSAEGSTDGEDDGTPDAEDEEETKRDDGSKRLVTALLDFACVLQYADDVIAK